MTVNAQIPIVCVPIMTILSSSIYLLLLIAPFSLGSTLSREKRDIDLPQFIPRENRDVGDILQNTCITSDNCNQPFEACVNLQCEVIFFIYISFILLYSGPRMGVGSPWPVCCLCHRRWCSHLLLLSCMLSLCSLQDM